MMSKTLLRFTSNVSVARAEIERIGGRIVHQFTPIAFVAEIPDSTDINTLKDSTAQPIGTVDYATQLAVDAWIANSAKAAAAPAHTEGLPWDTAGYESPLQRTNAPDLALALPHDSIQLSTGTPTSLYLTESVAVGLVLVSRDQGIELMTDAERTKIIQEVQAGLGWLATVEPRARLSWAYDIRPVTVNVAPGPYAGVSDPYERFESGWRDAALAAMGYVAGRPGYQQYANDLRSSQGTKWAYVAFFTKYNLNHFAYAIWEKVVMNYANDGWGPDNIHRVFAHESSHIFGAADEYGSCTCGGSFGQLGAPNSNCVNCFPPGAQVPCLMNANTLSICGSTRRQIGWDASLFPISVPPPREQVDANVSTFQAIDIDTAFVLGTDGNLWREQVTGQVPPPRVQVDANVASFQAIDASTVFVKGTDNKLWRAQVTGQVPPPRDQVDANVATFQAIDANTIYVLGTDGNLWRAQVTGQVPPPRVQVDANVASFQAIDANTVFVKGTDNKLWRAQVTGQVPPPRDPVDANVASFQALDANILFVKGTDNNLWREQVTGQVPPPRVQVDANVASFHALDPNTVFVKGTDNKLWREHVTGQVPPPREQVDANVATFQGINNDTVFVKGTDNNLWREHGPFA